MDWTFSGVRIMFVHVGNLYFTSFYAKHMPFMTYQSIIILYATEWGQYMDWPTKNEHRIDIPHVFLIKKLACYNIN